MIQRIQQLSLNTTRHIGHQPDTAVLLIQDPPIELPKNLIQGTPHSVLLMAFSNAPMESDPAPMPPGVTPLAPCEENQFAITHEQARMVVGYIRDLDRASTCLRLIVCCPQGNAQSAAVARWAGDYLHLPVARDVHAAPDRFSEGIRMRLAQADQRSRAA